MNVKSDFTDWYDYLIDNVPGINYSRSTRIEKIPTKYSDKLNLNTREITNTLEKFNKPNVGVWIGIYPNIFLCPTNPWEYDHIELNWWDIFNKTPQDWELEFQNYLKSIKPDLYNRYIKFIEGKSRVLYNNTDWVSLMATRTYSMEFGNFYRGNYHIINLLKNYASSNLEWDSKTKTFKKYCPEIFQDLNSPIFVSHFDLKIANVNPCLSEFRIPLYIENNSIEWDRKAFHIPDEIKEGNMNIVDEISEFLTAAHEPNERPRSDKEKIIANGFDIKTSFRKM